MTYNIRQNADGSTDLISALSGKIGAHYHPFRINDDFADFTYFKDDFHGDALDARWTPLAGIDAQAVAPATTVAVNGLVRLTTGDVGDTMANDGSQLSSALAWKASSGGLYMKARIKPVSSVANVCYNVGFTDTSALEMPATLSTTTFTTNASDGAVFVYDTAATNKFWHAIGVKANTDTDATNTAILPVADTYTTLEIAIDTAGSATFWIDGVLKASIANAVTTTVGLTPTIAATARTTTSKSLDVDYIIVSALRT